MPDEGSPDPAPSPDPSSPMGPESRLLTSPPPSIPALVAELDRRPARAGRTKVLAIDGPSGAGKTTLARQLLAHLPGAALLQLEVMYPGWDGLAQTPSLLVETVLAPLADGRPATYRTWDWARDTWGDTASVPAASVLVVEGVGSGARVCAPYLSLLVLVDAPRDLRRARGIERDGETYRPHWERWAIQEAALFGTEDTAARADVRVDGTVGLR